MLASLLLLYVGAARAGVFEHKTMHEDWPARQVMRDFVLPKGWMEAGLRLDHKSSGQWRDDTGALQTWSNGATFRYSRATLSLDQGFSRHTTLYLRVPWVWALLDTDRGVRTGTFAFGDAHAGIVVQPWRREHDHQFRPWGVAFRLDYKAPSGVEWPHNLAGGPDDFAGFLTGTGVHDVGLFVHGLVRAGEVIRVDASAGYVLKIPGIVGYVVQTDGFANGWLDPGDEVRGDVAVHVQPVDRLALTVGSTVSRRGWYRVGVSGRGYKLQPRQFYYAKAGEVFVDARAEAAWDALHWGVSVDASYQVWANGETYVFSQLGLEDYSPQPGLTVGAEGRVRW